VPSSDESRVLLEDAGFGERIAEDEVTELAAYFVETDQWRRLWSGQRDVVKGPKGSGKSALYSLLVQKANELFDRGILMVAGENPSGTPAFRDVAAEPPTSETEFVGLWKMYVLSLIADVLKEYEVETESARRVYSALEEAGLLQRRGSLQSRLQSVLSYVRRLPRAKELGTGVTVDPHTGMVTGFTGKIVLGEPEPEQKALGYVSLDELLAEADNALSELGYIVWILLDRLDVAFEQHEELEQNALRALFKAYLDMKALDQIRFKIFLRSDIWQRITDSGFREASHITADMTIEWDDQSLLQLMMRRVLRNQPIARYYGVDPDGVFGSVQEQQNLLARMLPDQVDGGRNPKTFAWMVSRTTDGSGRPAPRELIHLLSSLRDRQLRRLELGHEPPPTELLFDRTSFKEALREVSEVRLTQTLYAEYADLKPYIEQLRGEKAQQKVATLARIWAVDPEEARRIADRLVSVGFFERRGEKGDPDYWVPFLYRDALSLIQGEARV
jgi:hypothetical protein